MSAADPQARPTLSRRRWLRTLLAALPAAALLDAFAFEPRWLRTRRHQASPSPSLRFPFFTDVHFKGNPRLLLQVIDRIHAASPAPPFAVFGGDLIEDAAHLPAALELLGRLRIPLYGVPGNHDHWAGIDFDQVKHAFRRRGGDFLMDEAVNVPGTRLRITGFSCLHAPALAPAPGRLNLALIHYPLWADQLPPGWDLTLAGHSHGGQVRLPFLGPVITPTQVGAYVVGPHTTPAGPLFVSSGVGTFFLNVRFLCPPELVWVEL